MDGLKVNARGKLVGSHRHMQSRETKLQQAKSQTPGYPHYLHDQINTDEEYFCTSVLTFFVAPSANFPIKFHLSRALHQHFIFSMLRFVVYILVPPCLPLTPISHVVEVRLLLKHISLLCICCGMYRLLNILLFFLAVYHLECISFPCWLSVVLGFFIAHERLGQ